MSAIEELKHEHRVIERMLAVMRAAVARADKGSDLPPRFFNEAVDFIWVFADKCHHGKEEDNLFPLMERRGIPREGGPIGMMLLDHEEGRGYVRQMDEATKRLAAGDKTALKAALAGARGYADLLAGHIEKEDNILYPMADHMLSATDQQELVEKFEEVEMERLGPVKHEQYMELIARLEKEFGLK